MRLLTLRLGGFKSFVDPTTFSLRPGTVVVTGPNGAGKSNLIDAVRWVTGEISAKTLRGTSMADVLFNGSAQRKPASSAFVELVFDNSDGSLGGEYARYAEISVRRTVGRDGQSEYSLNGTSCRRRDIVDVFLGTGLGPHSYAVIEQGTIGRLVEARPEELRSFLEEAAGVSKYRERRRETASRIESARDNLSRLEDLAQEIEGRVNALARQARAAERYHALRDEQRRLDARLRSLRRRALVDERERFARERDEVLLALETLASERTRLDATLEALQQRRRAIQDLLQERRRRHHEVDREIASLESARTARAREREVLEGERRRLEDESRRLESERVATEELVRKYVAERDVRRPDHDRAKAELERSRAALEDARRCTAESAESVRAVEDARREARHAQERLALECEHLRRTRADLEARLEALGRDEASLPLEDWRRALDERRGELRRLEESHAAAAALREESRHALDALGEERKRLEAALEDLLRARAAAHEDHARLRARYEAAVTPADGTVRRWLEEHGLARGARLLDLLDVPAEARPALEALLDEAVGAVVVDDLGTFASALPAERGAALVLVDRRPASNAAPWPFGIRPIDPGLASFLSSVLAGVRPVAGLEEALARRSELAPGERFVTPRGEIVGPSWLRVDRTTPPDASVFALPEALARASAEEERLVRVLEETRTRLSRLAEEREECERRAREAQSGLQALEEDFRRVQAEEAALAARLAQAEEHARGLAEERTLAERRRAELAVRLQALEEDLHRREGGEGLHDRAGAEAEERLARAREALARAEDETRLAQEHERALAVALESCRIRCTAAERESERLAEECRRSSEALARVDERRAALAREDAADEARLPDLVTARLGLEKSAREAEDELRALDAEAAAHDETHARWQARHEDERVRLAALEQRLEEIARRHDELGPPADDADADSVPDDGQDLRTLEARATEIVQKLDRIGPVNLMAVEEYARERARGEDLARQLADVREGLASLEEAMRRIDRECEQRFRDTFERVNAGLEELFPRLFGGGHALLTLGREDGGAPPGVWFTARPPGKKPVTVSQLSGGEKSLAGLAFLFALFRLNPAPFCMLDEVDAALDETSVGRVLSVVRDFADRVQMILVSHNRLTLESADTLVGVTMPEPGVSRLVAVDVEEAVALTASA
jgi:chromosome segregation protein